MLRYTMIAASVAVALVIQVVVNLRLELQEEALRLAPGCFGLVFGLLRGGQDPLVAGAAAEVPRKALADGVVGFRSAASHHLERVQHSRKYL